MRLGLDEFDQFYRGVEAILDAQTTSNQARRWIRRLIKGFRSEFEQWTTLDYPLSHILHEGSSRAPLTRLLLHAYIHLAFDLPRVLAPSIESALLEAEREALEPEGPGMIESKASFLAREFFRPDVILAKAFGKLLRDSGLLPWPAVVAPDAFVEIPGLWLILMRHEAWHNAEKLVSGGNTNRKHLESVLAGAAARSCRMLLDHAAPLTALGELWDLAVILPVLHPPVLPPVSLYRGPFSLSKE